MENFTITRQINGEEVAITLTQNEINAVFMAAQHENDLEEIRLGLDMYREDHPEQAKLVDAVTEDDILEMADKFRKALDWDDLNICEKRDDIVREFLEDAAMEAEWEGGDN